MTIGLLVALGFIAACLVAAGGYRTRALSSAGAFAAVVVGTAIFGLGGLRWAAVLIGFFVLSSLLSRIGTRRKQSAGGFVEKGSRRDAAQVIANGGIAALVAGIHGLDPGIGLLFPAFVGSMAAATADTWSTEIGALSRVPPRSILSGKRVATGSSGGVTTLGLLGALAGAIVIGLISGLWDTSAVDIVVIATLAGFSGSLVDSLLGASIQRVNRCPTCLVLTEQAAHSCGAPTTQVGGWRFVNNDAVNGLTTLYGALCGGLLFLVLK